MLKQPYYSIKRMTTFLLAAFFVATLTVSSTNAFSSDNSEDNPGDFNNQGADQFKWGGHYWWDNEDHWRWDGYYWWENGQCWKWDGQRWWNGKQWWDGSKWQHECNKP